MLLPVALLCTIAAFGCNATTAETESDSGLIHVAEDDREMEAAIAEARRTVDDFIGHLKNPQQGMGMFAVKKPYPTRSGSSEHIWIEVTEFRDGQFYGAIANDPVDIEGISLGSTASAKKLEITDWLISTDNGTLGGFTKAVLDKLTGNQ